MKHRINRYQMPAANEVESATANFYLGHHIPTWSVQHHEVRDTIGNSSELCWAPFRYCSFSWNKRWTQTHALHYESQLLLSEGSCLSRSADFLKDTAQPCWVPAILPSSVLELALLPSIYFTTGPMCFKVVLAWVQTAKENRQLPLCRTFSCCWPWGLDWQSCFKLLFTTTLHNYHILLQQDTLNQEVLPVVVGWLVLNEETGFVHFKANNVNHLDFFI